MWEGEGEGRRSKANTALWVKAMTVLDSVRQA